MLLLLQTAFADQTEDTGHYESDFSAEDGAWSGDSVVTEGALLVAEGEATLGADVPADLDGFTLTARVRLATEGTLTFGAGGGELSVTIQPGQGLVAFGADALPLPMTHLTWAPEADPVFEAQGNDWEAGGVNHPEIFRDDDGTWFLYYTSWFGPPGYAYRQIGLATSPDGIAWTRYAGNPVLTIDYDLSAVDGVHVHMPTVTQATDGVWHMFYACYENNVGNRLCHATSPDGYAWTPVGVAVDKGGPGEFDEGSLRMPDVWIGPDGTWHLWYDGTDPEEHYGPTGYATSPDGDTWTKHGEILDFEHALQGLSVVETPYGLDALYNRDDYFVHASASPSEPTTWTESGSVLTKGWAWWNDGYIQAPTLWLEGTTYRMWFNGYTYTDGYERIGAAHSEPVPGTWLDVVFTLADETLTLTVDGAELSQPMPGGTTGAIHLSTTGAAELDSISLDWMAYSGTDDTPEDSGGDSGGGADTGTGDSDDSGAATSDCGCGGAASPGAIGAGLALLATARRRRNP
ncbi:hypothetical protein LBMAG42_50890 [Deltaproteobacteria bacterium]|nr:hypothetical protein LBMAG42_50890 [Deltaproteobacteria bacterium]